MKNLKAGVSKDTTGSAAETWKAIGDFCGIASWHPAVARCELSTKDGATMRTLTLQDGAEIIEKRTAFDPDGMSYSYAIIDSPLPVANYEATLKVVPRGSGATISWTGAFDAQGAPDADAVNIVNGIYEAGIDSLIAKTSK